MERIPDFDTCDLARAVESLEASEIDALPFGVIRLNRDLTVQFFSRREAALSGYGQRPTRGMNFFTQIAPCMNTDSVRGALDRAIAQGDFDLEFLHVGDFDDASRSLHIRAQPAAGGGAWLFINRE
ncbi:MAG TPA: PAS domain-containing protein [Burkholderiales bacterium]|nr:PAS domain-containing protein [Burkholderiales bacterium]